MPKDQIAWLVINTAGRPAMSRPDVHREGSRRPRHDAVACHAQMTGAPGMIAFDAGAAQRPTSPPTAARTG
jgi:hypothetical protein